MYQHSEETYPGSSAVTSTPRCNIPCHPQESMLHAGKGFMKKWMHSSQSVTKRHKASQSVTKRHKASQNHFERISDPIPSDTF